MKLLEAIVDANHRALAGDASAGVQPGEFADSLPLAALTCIDARLNAFFPGVLGLPREQFIWLRNAGNIITGPMSSTMRSLALACAVKGAKEIAVIGHTDCQVAKTSAMKLLDAFKTMGVDRHSLPENLTEFFGLFASERQNVMNGTDFVRRSPLIGPGIPVHGLVVDIESGRLEWVVNGYQTLEAARSKAELLQGAADTRDGMKAFAPFQHGEMKFPEAKIGEIVSAAPPVFAPESKSAQPEKPAPAAPPPLPNRKSHLPPIRPGYETGRPGRR